MTQQGEEWKIKQHQQNTTTRDEYVCLVTASVHLQPQN